MPLANRIAQVGEALGEALRAILEEIPGSPHRSQDLARQLSMKKDVSNRVLNAVKALDPVATTHIAPGPTARRRMINAAQAQSISAETTERARQAVDAFDQLIREEAGDRTAFDAMVTAWLPEARRKSELLSKQAVFRGMSMVKGAEADLLLDTVLMHPGSDEQQIDTIMINGALHLRRTRPGALVNFGSRRLDAADEVEWRTVEGDKADDPNAAKLDRFCRNPVGQLQCECRGDLVVYTLTPTEVGRSSAVDVIIGNYAPGILSRTAPPEDPDRPIFAAAEIDIPGRLLVFDAFVHRDLFDRVEPTLNVYDTSFHGVVQPSDSTRDIRNLEVQESLQSLGEGLDRCRVSEFPNYNQMIEYVCQVRGWEPSVFQAYRCQIAFPLYGSQVTLTFPRTGRR